MRASGWRRTAALLAVSALVAVGCSSDDGDAGDDPTDGGTDMAMDLPADVQAIADSGTLRVGVKFDQPLFGVNSPSGVVGFDAEIARIIASHIWPDDDPNDHIEFTEAVSANREPFLQNGEVDIVAATYTINEARDEVIDFAGPYYVAGQDIMVPKGNPNGITGIDDLNTADYTTCSVDGSTSIDNFNEMAPDGETITFDTYSKCAEAMNDGRADAVTTDNVILIGLIDQSPDDFELVDNPFTEEPYGIGVPDGSDMRCWINEVLQMAYDDGSWAAAYESTVGTAGSATPAPPALNNDGC